MSSTETPPRLHEKRAFGPGQVGPRDHERSWDELMAEAVAFLVSARADVQSLSSKQSCEPPDVRVLVFVYAKMVEALSALDDLCVSQWVKSGSTAPRTTRLQPPSLERYLPARSRQGASCYD